MNCDMLKSYRKKTISFFAVCGGCFHCLMAYQLYYLMPKLSLLKKTGDTICWVSPTFFHTMN